MTQIYKDDVIAQIRDYDWEFETYDDPDLLMMFKAVKMYAYHLLMNMVKPEEHPAYWLVLIGASETGKTHLIHKLYRFFQQHIANTFVPVERMRKRDLVTRSGDFLVASEMAEKAIAEFNYLKALNTKNVLFLDELDPRITKLAKDQICRLLSWRAQAGDTPWKWTVMTANLTREQIGSEFDPRISSRMRREPNVVIELPQTITAYHDR